MFKTFFGDPVGIITEAAKSPLGIFALAILVLAFLAFYFFSTESWPVRLIVFGAMFIIVILSFTLAIYPVIHPISPQRTQTEQPKPYAAYGIKYDKIIRKHFYFKDFSFKGEIDSIIINVSNTNLSILPPQQGYWFGWNIKSFELRPIAYGNDEGKYNLQRVFCAEDKIIRRDIDGTEKKVTLFTWQFKIEPAIVPGKSFHFGQVFETKDTERDAFTEQGSFAGMSSPFPVETLTSEVNAPEGYRFINKGYLVRDSMGIDVEAKIDEPEFSSDGSRINWTIKDPVPSLKYYMRIVIVKRN